MSRSIAGYQIFNTETEYKSFIDRMIFYRQIEKPTKYSRLFTLPEDQKTTIMHEAFTSKDNLVQIICYCLMPTHIHLLLKQLTENGISIYIRDLLDSYSRNFNSSHKRKGPLWDNRFKNVLIENDEQLLHLTRYIHLNPTSAGLVDNPKNWQFSSYHEYVGSAVNGQICNNSGLVDVPPAQYRKFCLERKSYQRELSKIKSITLENYTG